MSRKKLFAGLVAMIMILALSGPAAQAANRRPVKIEGKQVLPLRVLARPFSNVYKTKDPAQGTVRENVPVFQPFFVYTKPSAEDKELQQAWYEVGTDNRGGVIGWMKADDVFEWKQTMCLAYTHPEGRKPVLMFEGKKYLADLLAAPPQERAAKAKKLYADIESGQLSPQFPVISVEPKQAVDISKQFYLLPILDFQSIELDGREGRLVRLAAATAAGPDARQKSDIRQDGQYLKEANTGSTVVQAEVLSNLAIDLVWVMDTTVSMKKPIARTLEVIRDVSQRITADPNLAQAVNFGIWGYRDSVNDIPGIGYTTNNYTPQLQKIGDFAQTLATVQVTQVDSVDFPEDVFSGIDDAIRKTAWTPNALRIIILAADAPGHELGHKWNLSGQSAQTLRALADDNSVYIMVLHLKNPRAKKYHALAEEQFSTLGTNKGQTGQAAYLPVPSNDEAAFTQATTDLTDVLLGMLSQAKQGSGLVTVAGAGGGGAPTGSMSGGTVPQAKGEMADLEPEAAPANQPVPQGQPITQDQGQAAGQPVAQGQPTAQDQGQAAGQPVAQPQAQPAAQPAAQAAEAGGAKAMAKDVFKAALVRWIGSQTGAKAPRDIVAWAVDKDLLEPAIQSMEVRLLINKRQLDSLKTVLDEVMAAGRRGQIGGEDFFAALQATAATAARNPDQIKNAKSMAATGLVPEFLMGLPYKSRLMAMNNELWGSWSVDEQDEFLAELEAKVAAYKAIHDEPDGWITLNKADDPDDYVYPISLDLLP